MITIELLTEFLGWASVINIGIFFLATLVITFMRGTMIGMHGKLFALDAADLHRAYFQYLAQYKIAILVFNLAPYIALKIMA